MMAYCSLLSTKPGTSFLTSTGTSPTLVSSSLVRVTTSGLVHCDGTISTIGA